MGKTKPNGKAPLKLWVINTATDFKQENAIVGWARGPVQARGVVTLIDPMWMLIVRNEKGAYVHYWHTPGGSVAYDKMQFEVRSCVLAHEKGRGLVLGVARGAEAAEREARPRDAGRAGEGGPEQAQLNRGT